MAVLYLELPKDLADLKERLDRLAGPARMSTTRYAVKVLEDHVRKQEQKMQGKAPQQQQQ